jgi:TolB protein
MQPLLDQHADGNAPAGRGRRAVRFAAILLVLAPLVWLAWRGLRPAGDGDERSLKPTLAALSTELAAAQSTNDEPQPTTGVLDTPVAPDSSLAPGWVFFTQGDPGSTAIYAQPLDGAGPRLRLTDSREDAKDPAVSPDGSTLAYRSHQNGQWDLYLRDLASGRIRRLTETLGYEGHPTWSPDGRWIAYEASRGDDLDIWILAIDGDKPPIQLTNHPGTDHSPTWDPTGGRRIAFISDRDGSPDVLLADLDRPADRFVNLTHSPEGAEADPAFSPVGDQLAYATVADGLDMIWLLPLDTDQAPMQVGAGISPIWLADGAAMAAVQRAAHSQDSIVYPLRAAVPALGLSSVGAELQLAWAPVTGTPVGMEAPDDGPVRVEAATDAPASGGIGRMGLIALENVDAPNARLVEAASQPFRQLRQAVESAAGWDFLGSLDEAFVGLNDPLPPGFAYNDWLYTGRAFAFQEAAYQSGWVEVVPEPIGGLTYWRVFVKAARQDGSLGEPLSLRPWDFQARYRGGPSDYDQGGRPRQSAPGGYYVDFTALAEAHGFERQPALTNWRSFYPGARYTEFAYTEGYDWQAAMLQLYPLEAIVTPTPFSSPTPTPTITPWPTATPWWWRWRTPTFTPSPTSTPSAPPGL